LLLPFVLVARRQAGDMPFVEDHPGAEAVKNLSSPRGLHRDSGDFLCPDLAAEHGADSKNESPHGNPPVSEFSRREGGARRRKLQPHYHRLLLGNVTKVEGRSGKQRCEKIEVRHALSALNPKRKREIPRLRFGFSAMTA